MLKDESKSSPEEQDMTEEIRQNAIENSENEYVTPLSLGELSTSERDEVVQAAKKSMSGKRRESVLITAAVCFFCSLLAALIGVFIGVKIAAGNLTLEKMMERLSANTPAEITEGSVAQIAATVNKTVVTVYGSYDNTEAAGVSSGVAIFIHESKTYIATCAHAVEQYPYLRVRTYDGTEYEATIEGADGRTDMALLSVPTEGIAIAVPSEHEPVMGEAVVAIGNPLGTAGNCMAFGMVSHSGCDVEISGVINRVIKLDLAVNPGNSGGGVFDMSGKLMGIVTAKVSQMNGVMHEGSGFALPISKVYDIAMQLRDKGYVTGRPTVGISLASPVSAGSSPTLSTFAHSVPEDEGKLKAGDVMISVRKLGQDKGNMQVGASLSYSAAMANYYRVLYGTSAGDQIIVEFIRDGIVHYESVTVYYTE